MQHTNPGRLERWLGADKVAQLSAAMCNPAARWPGRPIAVAGVPGRVFVSGDGDFIGAIDAGYEMSALDRADDIVKRAVRRERARM